MRLKLAGSISFVVMLAGAACVSTQSDESSSTATGAVTSILDVMSQTMTQSAPSGAPASSPVAAGAVTPPRAVVPTVSGPTQVLLRDTDYVIEGLQYQHESFSPSLGRHSRADTDSQEIQAVRGQLIWASSECGSLVYVPGQSIERSVSCEPVRTGTGSCYTKSEASSTFKTVAAIDGDILTLSGTLKTRSRFETVRPSRSNVSNASATVTQFLRLRVTGNSCDVLELTMESKEDQVWSSDPGETNWKKNTYRAPANASCKIVTRSEVPMTPVAGEPLQPFDKGC